MNGEISIQFQISIGKKNNERNSYPNLILTEREKTVVTVDQFQIVQVYRNTIHF